jgi:hypothetical protein
MSMKEKAVPVFASGNRCIISVAMSLLDDSGIKYKVVENSVTEIHVSGDENIIQAKKLLMDLEELDFQE